MKKDLTIQSQSLENTGKDYRSTYISKHYFFENWGLKLNLVKSEFIDRKIPCWYKLFI